MNNLVSFYTILRYSVARMIAIWKQTLIAPLVSTSLYFIIFGTFIGSRVGEVSGFDYMTFIIPGIVMMPAITASYMQSGFVLFMARFQKWIEDILISPTSPFCLLAGLVLGGAIRGIIISTLTLIISLFFSKLHIFNIAYIVLFMVLTTVFFSLLGFASGLHARNFDDMNILPTFVLTPLTYLGGVFYSINALPEFWQTISKLNPILYMVNGFRYGFLGVSDVNVNAGIGILIIFIVIASSYNLYLMKKGVGLRT
ncbi:ABC transporter permease [Candidatus Woesearchaeota archaeon CG10_big_fil_rev_8_21_14_0_10_37_12]|nr:MAG: ABC transporter permease [Candidatus Woesearchaeota archaeon CG10_big_fil_rev_8_21_14_0_10_37_12]